MIRVSNYPTFRRGISSGCGYGYGHWTAVPPEHPGPCLHEHVGGGGNKSTFEIENFEIARLFGDWAIGDWVIGIDDFLMPIL
jgi:hypothetical protein